MICRQNTHGNSHPVAVPQQDKFISVVRIKGSQKIANIDQRIRDGRMYGLQLRGAQAGTSKKIEDKSVIVGIISVAIGLALSYYLIKTISRKIDASDYSEDIKKLAIESKAAVSRGAVKLANTTMTNLSKLSKDKFK